MRVFLRAKICDALVHEAKQSFDFKWHSTETEKQHSSRFCAVNHIPEGSARHTVCLAMGCTGGGLAITNHKTHAFQSLRSQTGRDKCKYFPLIYLSPRFLNAPSNSPSVMTNLRIKQQEADVRIRWFCAVGVWLTMCILLCTFMSHTYPVF